MTVESKILVGYNNPVVINITDIEDGDGNPITLSDFSKITATFLDDSRNTTDDPDDVVIASDTQLRLFFGDTDETGTSNWVISGTYSGEEYALTNKCLSNLGLTSVCT